MLDNAERKLMELCKVFPCYTCIVRPTCFQTISFPPKEVCENYRHWIHERDKYWEEWTRLHGKEHESRISYLFEIAEEEMKKDNDNGLQREIFYRIL